MPSQIRRAALLVHLNIAEGASRKSGTERKRFFETSRGFIVEVDAALDVAQELGYLKNFDLESLQEHMIRCFKMLCGLIDPKNPKL